MEFAYLDIRRGLYLAGRVVALSGLLGTTGCSAVQDGHTFARYIAERPLPVTENDRSEECQALRNGIEREIEEANRRAVFAEGMEAVENRANLEQHLLALEARMARLACPPSLLAPS